MGMAEFASFGLSELIVTKSKLKSVLLGFGNLVGVLLLESFVGATNTLKSTLQLVDFGLEVVDSGDVIALSP
jgi:hypothetical protein